MWLNKRSIFTIVILVLLSPLAFGDPGYETNGSFTIPATHLGINDNDAWIGVERRDTWDNKNIHVSDHWQVIVGTTTKSQVIQHGIGYRYITGTNSVEHRPHIFVTPQLGLMDSRLKLSVRSKVEYRIRSQSRDGFRYKIKPKIKYKFQITPQVSLSPFVGDEITYSTISGEWGNNKVEVGIGVTIFNRYTLTPYYEYESDIPSGDKDESRFGLTASLAL